MPSVRHILIVLVAALGLAGNIAPGAARAQDEPVQQLVATTADLLDLATYTIRTELALPGGGTKVRTQQALIGVPALVDVHGTVIPIPDLIVNVLPVPTEQGLGARLDVIRAPLATGTLPVRVEAVFDLPGDDDLGVAFGYDQRAARAPTLFSADVGFSIFNPSRDEYELTVRPLGAGSSLTIIGELFTATGGERVDPKAGRFELSPVPPSTTVGLTIESTPPSGPPAGVTDEVTVVVDPSSPTTAKLRATEGRDSFERVVDATLATLPDRATVVYTDEEVDAAPVPTTNHRVVDYVASGPVGRLDLTVTESTDDVVDQTIVGTVEGVPASFHADLTATELVDATGVPVESLVVDWTAADSIPAVDLTLTGFAAGAVTDATELHATDVPSAFLLTSDRTGVDDPATPRDERPATIEFTALSGPLGTVEGGVATDRPVVLLDDPEQLFADGELQDGERAGYVLADGDDVSFRIDGLTHAFLDTADPLRVVVDATPAPFVARAVQPDREIAARVLDRSGHVEVTYGDPSSAAGQPKLRTIDYLGSAPVDKVVADVVDRTGDRPVDVTATLTAVPADVSIDLSTQSSALPTLPPVLVDSYTVGYRGSTPIGAADMFLDTETAEGKAQHVEGHLQSVPEKFDLSAVIVGDRPLTEDDDPTARVEFRAGAGLSVGSINAGVAVDGPVQFLDPRPFFDKVELGAATPAYAFAHQTGGAVHVAGVSEAIVDTGNPMQVHLRADQQKLLVRQVSRFRSANAKVMDMPSRVDVNVVRGSDDTFTATYDASAPITRTELFVTDSNFDIGPDIRSIDAHIDGVPTQMTIGSTGTGFVLDVPDDPRTADVRERVVAAQVLLTDRFRDAPAADGTLESFLTETGRLEADEDGVAIETIDTNPGAGVSPKRTVYGRARDVTRASLSNERTFAATDGYRDDQTFQRGEPKALEDVPLADNAFDLGNTMGVALGRVSGGPLGVRVHDDVRAQEYFEARLNAPPSEVALTIADHQKRVDSNAPCVPNSATGCLEFELACNPRSDNYSSRSCSSPTRARRRAGS